MKTNQLLFLFIALIISYTSSAQIRVGGGVSVDVSIDIPLPEIVITKRRPAPPVHVPPPPRREIHVGNHSFGTINNQNTPNGRYVYDVVNANFNTFPNGNEQVSFNLDTGETLELVISTANPNDYNYHYNNHNYGHNNAILAVILNGQEIPLRDGSLSLQPQGNGGAHIVINLHSVYEGDFNGTINI